MKKYYKVYRETGRSRTLVASRVDEGNIGAVMSDDLHRHFAFHLFRKSIGQKIVRGMKADNLKDWSFYPEDFGVPAYDIVEEK